MKELLVAGTIAVCCVLRAETAFGVGIPPLPDTSFPDTEVSTNFTFAVGAVANRKLVFTLELQASPSNNVEVAIGCDANGDGHLSIDETELTVGYDCGEWVMRSAAKDDVTYSDVEDTGTFRRTYEVRSRKMNPDWNLVKVTRRGLPLSSETVSFSLIYSGFGLSIQ